MSTETAPEEKPITKPPTRWRNWHLNDGPKTLAYCDVCRTFEWVYRGPYHGCRIWPSKDSAETQAALEVKSGAYLSSQYLGAYPEGERP